MMVFIQTVPMCARWWWSWWWRWQEWCLSQPSQCVLGDNVPDDYDGEDDDDDDYGGTGVRPTGPTRRQSCLSPVTSRLPSPSTQMIIPFFLSAQLNNFQVFHLPIKLLPPLINSNMIALPEYFYLSFSPYTQLIASLKYFESDCHAWMFLFKFSIFHPNDVLPQICWFKIKYFTFHPNDCLPQIF